MGTILSHLQTSSITRFHIAEKKSIFIELCVFQDILLQSLLVSLGSKLLYVPFKLEVAWPYVGEEPGLHQSEVPAPTRHGALGPLI